MKKVLFLLVLPLLAELLVACIFHCDCLAPVIHNYTNCSLSIDALDNSGEKPIVSNSDSIPKAAFGVRLTITRKLNVCEAESRPSLFLPPAYATSCDCPDELQYQPLDSIVSVKIYTLNDFDSSHMAMAEITDYFRVFRNDKFIPVTDHLNQLPHSVSHPDYLDYTLDLLLMNPPATGKQHQFKVEVVVTDGRQFVEQTALIELL